MRKALFVLIFFLSACQFFGQSGGIDQYDYIGRKNGTWRLYYDKYWRVVSDSSKAAYYWYAYYDHGERVYTEASWGCEKCRLVDSIPANGSLKLLSGKYTWYDKKGKLFSEHYFKDGNPVLWRQYHGNGKLYLLFDYTKKCEGEPLSYWMYIYDKKGVLKNTLPISRGCGGQWCHIK